MQTAAAAANVRGSPGLTPKRMDSISFAAPIAAGGSRLMSTPRIARIRMSQHHPDYRSALRPQRYADSDLARAPRHRVRRGPVQSGHRCTQ